MRLLSGGKSMIYEKGDVPPRLAAVRKTLVPALAWGIVLHDVWLDDTSDDTLIMLPEPGTALEYSIMLDLAPIQPGQIVTRVFNLSPENRWILMGDVVSRLVIL